MTDVKDFRVLYGKLSCMETEVQDAYKAIRRLEDWIVGIKKMLERIEGEDE